MSGEDSDEAQEDDQLSYGAADDKPAAGTLRSAILDVELAGGNRREALSNSANATYSARSSGVRDILNISITVLIGSLALYSAAPELVKSPVLFFVSAALLLSCVLVSLTARLQLTDFLENATAAIENYYTELVQAASAFKLSASDTNLRRFKNADEAELTLPELRWFAKHGPAVVAVLFVSGIVGIGLSLLFRISLS